MVPRVGPQCGLVGSDHGASVGTSEGADVFNASVTVGYVFALLISELFKITFKNTGISYIVFILDARRPPE